MRRRHWMTFALGAVGLAMVVRPAAAQPGHAPFVFAPFEIEDYERALAPAGIANATILNPGLIAGSSHPAVIANGNMTTNFQTGAPIFLDRAQSAWQQWGGILGNTSGGAVTPTNYHDLFPGGTAVSPGGFPNGGPTRNTPVTGPNTPNPAYNGTRMSLVTRTDANTEDDVAITSGNQALRVEMLNVDQGDPGTSFDRPVMLTIKEFDFWGVEDSRFDSFELVRADPGEYNVSVDITFLASEIPDTFETTETNPMNVAGAPYMRAGFISGHASTFDESPVTVLQHPPSLILDGGDEDEDDISNFTDTDFVDPNNTATLPGVGVPGVSQRRYVFPASAMEWPENPLAGLADVGGNRHAAGGANNAYLLGFVFNSNPTLNTYASFFVDNMRFIERNPLENADFNDDGLLNVLDWQILMANMNGLTPPDKTFAQGDIGSLINEPAVSPGVVDFLDFVRFEEIWDKHNGGAGSLQRFLAGVPEPATAALVLIGLGAMACWRRRSPRRVASLLVAAAAALWSTSASAELTDTLLFSFEQGSFPDALQRWQPSQTGGVDNATLATGATGATDGTQALAITQTATQVPGVFTNVAFVSIFGSQSGLPPQQDAFNAALDVGANHYVLEMDVTYRDAMIPPTSYIDVAVTLSAGSATTDTATYVAPSSGTTDVTVPVSIPLSIAPVLLTDTVLSVPTQAASAGSYNIAIGLDGEWAGNATVFVDNIHLRQVSQPPKLTLEINQTTGAATIKNVSGEDAGTGDVFFDYYEIRSVFPAQAADYNGNGTVDAADYTEWRDTLGEMVANPGDGADGDGDGMIDQGDYVVWKDAFGITEGNGTSLNPAGWNSLDTQNVDAVDGTDPGTTAGDSPFEGWYTSGSPSSAVLSEGFLLGSSTWNNLESRSVGNIYTPGMPQNVVFSYREPTRRDFLVPGLVTYVGGGAGGASAVPEPGTFALALVAGLAIAARKRT